MQVAEGIAMKHNLHTKRNRFSKTQILSAMNEFAKECVNNLEKDVQSLKADSIKGSEFTKGENMLVTAAHNDAIAMVLDTINEYKDQL